MPLTIPTLDNRRYQDLLNEALARISVHNPEWTNFNESDPGVTLLELFAFLTENLLYRSNQIPERNRRKFLSLLGIPLALTLALLAAALDFIPNIGPLASAVPALLLALLQGPTTALWVMLLYVIVQVVESYILAPLVQRRAVSLPPALLLGAQVLLPMLFGFPGLLLATPVTVLLLVVVRNLYVEAILEPHPQPLNPS